MVPSASISQSSGVYDFKEDFYAKYEPGEILGE